jgi:hypothetical protein
MKSTTKLISTAVLAAVLTISAGARADARATAAKPAAPAPAPAAEVAELRAEIQANQHTLADAQSARAAAQAAADRATALQAQADSAIKTIPGEVKTAVAAARPKPGWEAATTLSGRMYYDLTGIGQKKDGAKVPASGASLDIKRFYVGVDHKFNDTYSANVTTDVAYVAADGLTQVYLKKAYLQAKVSDALTLRLGSADLPWVPFAEEVYGYRFVENTVTDRDKFATSADWGAHALGKLGAVNYAVSVVNGAGYKNPTRSKDMDVEARISTSFDGITLGAGAYSGKLGKAVQNVATFHTANRVNLIAAYANAKFRIGAEYFAAENWANVTTIASDKSAGASVFGSYNVTPQISAFGRYDSVKPSKTINPREKEGYFNLGLNYEPAKTVDFALVYKRDAIDNGSLATSNGTIGGTRKGTYDELGLFGQFRW